MKTLEPKFSESGECTVLARLCSNNSVFSLACAVTTKMFRPWGFGKGKGFGDFFFDGHASNDRDSKGRGRISFGICHFVGEEAWRLLVDSGAFQKALGSVPSFEYWEEAIDRVEWCLESPKWNQPEDGRGYWTGKPTSQFRELEQAYRETLPASYRLQGDELRKTAESAWRICREGGLISAPLVVMVTRLLNSWGKYAYIDKYPDVLDLIKAADGPDVAFESVCDFYAEGSKRKAGRVEMIKAVMEPFQFCPVSLGDWAKWKDGAHRIHTVRDVQSALKAMGYTEVGKIDGVAGTKTARACESFARDHDLLYQVQYDKIPTPYLRMRLSAALRVRDRLDGL